MEIKRITQDEAFFVAVFFGLLALLVMLLLLVFIFDNPDNSKSLYCDHDNKTGYYLKLETELESCLKLDPLTGKSNLDVCISFNYVKDRDMTELEYAKECVK